VPYPLVLFDSIAGRAHAVAPTFACSTSDGGLHAAWVHVAGELDVATTPQLERALREVRSQAPLVVLDLRDLAFMDSSGVRAIVDASIRAREVGRRLVLLRGPRHVDRLFALTGSSGDVERGYVDRVEPPVEALPPREGRVATIRRPRAPYDSRCPRLA
jgi:anti-anti-sigma factor